MLPTNLLRARVSRGNIRPLYAILDAENVALAEKLMETYGAGIGKKKGELLDRLIGIENQGYDFKLVRGLSTLLERRSTFVVDSALNPVQARKAVFIEASKVRASTPEQIENVLKKVSAELRVSRNALEKALFSDVDDELILQDFKPFPNADTLIRYYNLSLTQTMLFKSLRMEFSASGNWKSIFRSIKWLGLIYSVERDVRSRNDGGQFRVSLDGPLSLFKMTERYGTSIAKLLPHIAAADSWAIKAEILARSGGGRVFNFEANSEELKGLITNVDSRYTSGEGEGEHQQRQEQAPANLFDSSTEEKFSRSFHSYATGWTLRREPEPLLAGTHVLIPDFSFEKHGMKVYLEVVGFWTHEYLERKIVKLNSIPDVDMIVAADESLACSKLERLKTRALVIYYKKEVPLKPIIEHLKEREASIIREQVDRLSGISSGMITSALKGDVISIKDIAAFRGVAEASVKIALKDFNPEGYARVGDLFISTTKLEEIDKKLRGIEWLVDALHIIEASGVKEEEGKVLDALGYTSTWAGMDVNKVRISKPR